MGTLEITETGKIAGIRSGKFSSQGHAWFVSYLLSNVSGGLTSPLIPLFVVLYLHYSVVYVGITSSLASAASVPALIFWGNLSDALKRRKVFIVIGFTGSFLSLLLILITHTIGMYIATLVIFQIVAMASTPVATLLILESTVEKKWPNVMASFNTVSYIGLVAGLAAGTVILNVYGSGGTAILPLLYLMSAIVYLAAALSAIFLLPEPRKKLPRNSDELSRVASFRTIERMRYFPSSVIHLISLKNGSGKKLATRTKIYILYTCILMLGFQIFFVPFPVFVLNRLGGTETEVFIMYLMNNVASMVAFRISGKSVNRVGITRTLSMAIFSRVGILAFSTLLGLYLMAISASLWIGIACYSVMGFFWSFISIGWVTSISKLAIPENRGKAIGYYNSFLGIGQIAGGLISGFVSEAFGYPIDFLLATVVVLSGGLMLLRFQRKMEIYITGQQSSRSAATGN